MDRDQLIIQAARYRHPETLPVSVGILPSLWRERPDAIYRLVKKYPGIFGEDVKPYDDAKQTSPTYHAGQHVDEWGCVWSNIAEGQESYVTGHPVPNREDISALEIPPNTDGRMPHGFMYLRLLDLRGFEEAMLDFAEEPPELQTLIDKVLQYNLIQMDTIVKRPDPIIWFGDDLGMQKGLAIGKEKWIKYLKPAFAAIYKKARDAGKLCFMHTDGCIWEIMPDLYEAGADIINPQFRANGLENLVRVCRGKIPIYLDLDRQLLPFATPDEITAHVRECVEALYLPEGGLGLTLELMPAIAQDTIEAAVEAVERARHYKGTW